MGITAQDGATSVAERGSKPRSAPLDACLGAFLRTRTYGPTATGKAGFLDVWFQASRRRPPRPRPARE